MNNNNYIYYNVSIDSKTSQGQANFNETRVQPILDNPSEYELTIERFYVPAVNIPIMIFKDNKYSITLSFDGVDITKTLIWIPNKSYSGLYGKDLWNYQEMLDIVNKAFSDAYIDLKLAKPTITPTEPPFITYDAETNLFIFNAQRLYDPIFNGGPTVEIYMNIDLFALFNSFQDFEQEELEPKAHQILVKDNKNNISTTLIDYYSTYGEWVTLFGWNDLQSIVFETNSIPVIPENQQSQINQTQQIITDFEPIQDINNRSAIQFFPQGELRYYSLNSTKPFYNMNLNVMWKDKEGNFYPIYINDTETLTIKILFRKKLYL